MSKHGLAFRDISPYYSWYNPILIFTVKIGTKAGWNK
jgi:hypothetical protein